MSPERRLNLLTGDWVLVSPQRVSRPWQGAATAAKPATATIHDPACYLCAGVLRASGDLAMRSTRSRARGCPLQWSRRSQPSGERRRDRRSVRGSPSAGQQIVDRVGRVCMVSALALRLPHTKVEVDAAIELPQSLARSAGT